MTDHAINSTPIPARIEEAWRLIAGAAARDVLADITLSEAADALVDVYPPYPPAQAPAEAISQDEAVTAARAVLARAAATAGSAEEQLRIATTLHLLRDLDAADR